MTSCWISQGAENVVQTGIYFESKKENEGGDDKMGVFGRRKRKFCQLYNQELHRRYIDE